MKSSRKSSKRAVASFQEPQWFVDPDSGLYYYIDENGQQHIETEPETPRTDTAHAEPFDETGLGNQEYADDEPSGYTHTASQEAVGGYEQELAAATEGLNVGGYEEDESHHHIREAQAATGSSSKGKSTEKKSSKRDVQKPSSSKTKKDSKSKGKGKGKEKETRPPDEPGEPFYEPEQHRQGQQGQHQPQHLAHRPKRPQGHHTAPPGVTGGATEDDTQPVDGGYGARSTEDVGSGGPYYPIGTGEQAVGGAYHGKQYPQDEIEVPDELNDPGIPTDAGYGSGFLPEEDDDNNDDLRRAMAESQKTAYAEPASYDYTPGYDQPESSFSSQDADYGPVVDEEDDGSVTPTRDNPGLEPDQVIRGTGGNYEPIDARYRVESSHKFQPGEVFKILWSEPQGQSRDNFPNRVDIETYTERLQLENDWGERFYVGFRRFIVVANDEGHCTCVPILTYIRQGCKKRGVKPAKHGIIHELGTKPRPLEGEPKLGFKPIRLEIKATGERLARESRVNYSKLVTVEHNVKVFFIGNIQSDDFDHIVPQAVDRCWQEKIRKRVKKGLANVPRN